MVNLRSSTIQKKILFTFLCLWIVGSSFLVLMSYRQTKAALLDGIRARERDCAALGAIAIPAERHARLMRREDEGTEDYRDIVAILRKIKASSPDMRFVYTVRKGPDGKVMFVGDAAEDEAELSHLGDAYDDAGPLLVKSVEGLSASTVEKDFYTDKWGTFLSAYAPISLPDGRLEAVLCIDISLESVVRVMARHSLLSLILMAVGIAAIVPIAILLSRGIALPIKACVAYTELLARNDYTKDVPEALRSRRDELGELARAYGKMLTGARGLVRAIKEQSGALSGVGEDLASSMDETAASINQMNANIQSIQRQTIDQSAGVEESAAAMQRIAGGIRRLSASIDQQAAGVSQSSSAIEEMLANVASVTDTLAKNADDVKDLSAASEAGRSDLASVSGSIREIARESEGLMEISSVIQAIASQTDLLSMNAAIEAAHAGEAGRGFAVVADEIRKLAESSGEQSKVVSSSLQKIGNAMDGIASATETVLGQFEAIDQKIKALSEREQGIRSYMSEQNAGSREILEAIGQLSDITVQVKSGFAEMSTGSEEVIRESEELGRLNAEVAGSMGEMASGVGQIAVAMNRVNDISRDNKESIQALLSEVAKFKA
jgi:methyl-accepting chemotaxis protein